MDPNNPRKDINLKSLFKRKDIIAPLLKAVIKEYENLDTEEIIKLLEDPEDPNSPYVRLLDKEDGGEGELTTIKDLLFSAKTPEGYYLIINIEFYNSDSGFIPTMKNRTYTAGMFTKQQHRLNEIKESDENFRYNKIYSNLARPVQISVFVNSSKTRKNKIVGIVPDLKAVEFTDGLSHGKIEEKGKLPLNPSEIEAYLNFERIRNIYLDTEDESPVAGIFEYLRDGILSNKDFKKKQKVIRKYTTLRKDTEMALNIYYGNREYFINEGKNLGRKEGLDLGKKEQRKQDINKYASKLMEESKGKLSKEVALQEAESFFKNLDS